jgi:Flp pilus assembly protein TadG
MMERSRVRGRAAGLWACRAGNSVIELALALPILLLLLVGIANYGAAAYRQTAIVNAARTGIEYVARNNDTSAVAQVVAKALETDPSTLTISTTQFCECGDVAATCGALCSATPPAVPQNVFLTINVSEPFTPLIDIPVLPYPAMLSARATFRMQ